MSQKHELWMLYEFLEFLTPLSGHCAVHCAVIRTQRHVHQMSHPEWSRPILIVFVHNYAFLSGTNSKDATLRRVDNCTEIINPEHAQVRDRKCPSTQLTDLKFVFSGSSRYVLNFSGDLLQALQVGVCDNGRHEAVLGLDGDAHVDVRELTDEVSHPL